MFTEGLNLRLEKVRRGIDPAALATYVPPPVKPVDYFSYGELVAARGSVLVFDVECYVNYFCVAFMEPRSGKAIVFERSVSTDFAPESLLWVMRNFVLVGFNSRNYDVPMCAIAIRGYDCEALKQASDAIIVGGIRPEKLLKEWDVNPAPLNHVDLIEVAPIQASLKTYAARIHCKRIQDLPFEPDRVLSAEEAHITMLYCVNDLDNTALLMKELEAQLELRHQLGQEYNQDLRSMSDAQIAEAVIINELRKLSDTPLRKPELPPDYVCKYQIPAYLQYKTPQLQRMLATVGKAIFQLDGAGRPRLPPELDGLSIQLGACDYRLGIGGLHSSEKSIAHVADAETLLLDRDVASYYPAIILNQGLFPKHLGQRFLTVYRSIVERRLEAKRSGNKIVADSLKITINGSFGKLGSPYSMLYSPDLLLQVTITGQLSLLLFIEKLELVGIPVVSANTDGIIIKCPQGRKADMLAVIAEWEAQTGFETEETRYRAVYSRDVNNYIAIKEDGSCKAKGVYSEKGSALNSRLSKNPEHLICADAVQAFLSKGIPVEETVVKCRDFTRFVSVKKVTGGAHKDGQYLGKVVRWYYAKGETGAINRATNGDKVGKSDFGKPAMDLPDAFPNDVDFDWYIRRAKEILSEIGFYNQNGKGVLL